MNKNRAPMLAYTLAAIAAALFLPPSPSFAAPVGRGIRTPHFASFKAAREAALRPKATEAAKTYPEQIRPAIAGMVIEARKAYTGPGRGSGPSFEMDFAFVIGEDGRIKQMLYEPDLPFARYVAAQLPSVRLPQPPELPCVVLTTFRLQR